MRIWLKMGIIFLCIPMAYADESKSVDSVTLKKVIVKVLENNPTLKANDYESRIAAEKIKQAGLTKPVKANLEVENFAGSNRFNRFDSVETTLSLVKILESGNKPALRGDVAQQEANLLQNEMDAKRLDLLSKAARRFIHVAVDQERLGIAGEKLALIKRTADIVDQRVKLGRSPVAEQRRVAIAFARAEIELEHAEHELLTSRLKLSTMWGETAVNNLSVKAALYELANIEPFDQLETLLQKNPDLIKFASKQRLAEARLNLSQSRRRPDVALSGGIRYFSGTDDGALLLSASIPLESRKRALPDIQASMLMAEQEPLLYEQRRLALYTSLFEFYQELLHARTAVDALREKIIPEAELALRDYEKGFKAGRYSLLELTEAQQTLLITRLEVVVAAEKFHRNRIEIERLTGTEIKTGARQ